MRLGEVRACGCACAAIATFLVGAAGAAPAGAAEPLPPLSEARPPLPPEAAAPAVPWQEHIEVGGGVAFIEMPATVASGNLGAAVPTPVRFRPSIGVHADLSWQIFRYLRFTGYLIEHQPSLVLPPGSLNVPQPLSGSSVDAYTFGVRASPTLPIGSRVRLWITGGWGFRYLGYSRFTLPTEPTGPNVLNPTPTIPSRTAMFFEIPVGVGGAIMLIPRWLSLHFEMTGSFLPSQIGNAICQSGSQSCATPYLGYNGMTSQAAPMPHLDAVFVQTLGLSLHL
jgi:hypothetical protein